MNWNYTYSVVCDRIYVGALACDTPPVVGLVIAMPDDEEYTIKEVKNGTPGLLTVERENQPLGIATKTDMQTVLNVTKVGKLLLEIEQQGYANADGQLLTNDANWHRVRQAVEAAEKQPRFFLDDTSLHLIEQVISGNTLQTYSMAAVVTGDGVAGE